jgi:hypothetical protein
MRRLFLGVVLMLLSCAAIRAQGHTVPPLQRLIDQNFEVRTLVHECSVPDAVSQLARRFHIQVGVEYPPGDCQRIRTKAPRGGEVINLLGLSIAEALERLTAMDGRYRWIEHDGVIVMRPVNAWGDRSNILNFTTTSFALENVNLGGALDAVMSAVIGKPKSGGELLARGTKQGARTFSVQTGPTSVGGALDAIVRAHGDLWWQVLDFGDKRMIFFYTFDESGLGIPVGRIP